MSIIATRSGEIIESSISSPTSMNGKIEVFHPVETGAINPSSAQGTLRDFINGDVSNRILRAFPSNDHLHINPLLDATDYDFSLTRTIELDDGQGTLRDYPPRLKQGDTPNVMAVMSNNTHQGYNTYGVAITNDIALQGQNVQTVTLFWKVVHKTFSQDKTPVDTYAPTTNEPTTLTYEEVDPSLFSVYITNNGGITYESVSYLQPVSFSVLAQNVTIAFVNRSDRDAYILTYGIMY